MPDLILWLIVVIYTLDPLIISRLRSTRSFSINCPLFCWMIGEATIRLFYSVLSKRPTVSWGSLQYRGIIFISPYEFLSEPWVADQFVKKSLCSLAIGCIHFFSLHILLYHIFSRRKNVKSPFKTIWAYFEMILMRCILDVNRVNFIKYPKSPKNRMPIWSLAP